ncbi:unnamed protein product [Rotaria magnacalcarata]|uniref:Uncharacterized protein n=6 Tax=Rotaria magnacalcarata TaxID=392030 RepID=A0A816VEM7_9BILA|nr:unnamed protein product [Rotaria magnacalcarata]CAF4835927.1 unnamed protein product [Rotaria magnacalcarata]
MVVGCALDNLQFALAQGNGFRILAVDLRIAGRQLGSNVSDDDILVDPTTHGVLVFMLVSKPYDLPDQTAYDIRLCTNAILQSYDLKLDQLKYIIIDHALSKPDINCNDIQKLFDNVLNIITYIRRSRNQSKLSKKLQIFSETRWNSVYDMICSFIEVYPELNDILTDKKQREILVRIDFNDLLACAKYFVDVTELLNAKKTPTIRLVMPLKEHYWEINDVHFIAIVLHPKFKHLHICPNKKDKKKAFDLIIKEIENRRTQIQASVSMNSIPTISSSSSTANDSSIGNNHLLSSCYDRSDAMKN